MPDMPSITIVKSFTYRGAAEEFSNTYHFSGTTPVDAAAWKALADAIIAAEKLTVDSTVTFVQAYGYVAGNNNSVAQIDYRLSPNVVIAGTGSFAGGKVNGDVAAMTRWQTPDFTTRGKRIYLRKFWHGVFNNGGAGSADDILPAQRTAFNTFAAKLIDGTLPGTFKYAGPQGAVASAPVTSQFLTTRTLKRRGKRPPT